ncbi:MAG: hypothetical protein F4Y86_07025 [Gammaproteobacteria bacterium]|nr:hypothetical protein [Gammaproteobacteria bacterium]
MAGLFEGVRVVEIGHPLTEYAGALWARLGADVYLVELPEGVETRRRLPRVPGAGESSRGSMAFLVRNAGKRSVVFDADSAADRKALLTLCDSADVVLDADGSAFHEIVAESRVPVAATVTDTEGLGISSIVGFAAGGGMASSGWPHQPPCNAPSWLAHDGAGTYAAVMAAVGLLAVRGGADSARYEIPVAEAATAATTPWTRILHSHETHAVGQGTQAARLGPNGFPIYETKDGYVRCLAGTPKQWRALVELLGSPEELASGPFVDPKFRAENADALKLLTEELMRAKTTEEAFLEGQRLGLTISPVLSLRQFQDDAHTRARGMLQETIDPEFGEQRMVRTPFLLEPEALNVVPTPAPALNQHGEEARGLARQAGVSAGKDASPAPPLAGVRVLELGVGAVVPEAASLLALLGAEVIKLESHVHVDFLRRNSEVANASPTFNQLNLGVKSLAMDMTHPEAVEIARTLVAECDIIMENMRGPIVRRWGLDYAGAKAIRKDVIYLGSQGLGTGPYDGFQTYGPNLQTFAGVTHQWAHPDDPFPVGTTLNHPDHIAGKQALVALIGALLRRRETGQGCFIDATQVEGAAFLIADRHLQQCHSEEDVAPLGNRSPDMAPHGCYRCADQEQEERWLALAVENDEQWQALRDVVDTTAVDLSDAALASKAGRLAAQDAIDAALAAWLRPQAVTDAERTLRAAGVPASRVVTGNDMASEQTPFFPALSHPVAGTRHYTGVPVLRDGKHRVTHRRPPLLGEHTEYVLHDLLRLDADEIERLTAARIVGH